MEAFRKWVGMLHVWHRRFGFVPLSKPGAPVWLIVKDHG